MVDCYLLTDCDYGGRCIGISTKVKRSVEIFLGNGAVG